MVLTSLGCSGLQRGDGLDPSAVPDAYRADYELFADRCSRCHSLARPLSAGVNDEAHWRLYLRRMRNQPASGISAEDEPQLLRFLTWYAEQRRARQSRP